MRIERPLWLRIKDFGTRLIGDEDAKIEVSRKVQLIGILDTNGVVGNLLDSDNYLKVGSRVIDTDQTKVAGNGSVTLEADATEVWVLNSILYQEGTSGGANVTPVLDATYILGETTTVAANRQYELITISRTLPGGSVITVTNGSALDWFTTYAYRVDSVL